MLESEFLFFAETAQAYLKAFHGAPWYETDLTIEEVSRRLNEQASKPGFDGIWIHDGQGELVCASWYDTPDLGSLQKEQGKPLRDLVESLSIQTGAVKLVWQRETIVSPQYQTQGLALIVKQAITSRLKHAADSYGSPIIVATRMRDDNVRIIKVNEKVGFERTGVKVESRKTPGKTHEYWFQLIKPENVE